MRVEKSREQPEPERLRPRGGVFSGVCEWRETKFLIQVNETGVEKPKRKGREREGKGYEQGMVHALLFPKPRL